MRTVEASERIIVPLDVASASAACDLVRALKGHVGAFKVGLELVHVAGFDIFDVLRAAGAERIFYDCKLHDIPNTVAGAARAIAGFGVWMFNVHAAGGSRMVQAARRGISEGMDGSSSAAPLLLGVTLLTSLGAEDLANELRVDLGPTDYVERLAHLATQNGCDGVVCSPHEIKAVRERCGDEALIVTPGVRPAWASANDQSRIMTPSEAVRRGADYLVIGRPITAAEDPVEAADAIAREIRAVSTV